jgi:hypothetical protein
VKLHPEIDPNLAIKEATRSRRSATIRRRYQPPQPFPIPTTEHDGWDRTESQAFSESNRLTLSQLEVAKLTPFFQPDTLSLVYDPQIEPTKTAIKEVPKSEDVHPLELLNASDDRATSPPMEEPAQPATTLGAFARTVQFWLVLHMRLATQFMIYNPSTTLSGLRTWYRRSARLNSLLQTAHRLWKLHLSPLPHHLLVGMVTTQPL